MVSLHHLVQLPDSVYVVAAFAESSSQGPHGLSEAGVLEKPNNMLGELAIIVCHEHLFIIYRVDAECRKAG